MCGFVCLVNRRSPHPRSTTVIPDNLLQHRGPDHTDEVVHGNVAIRHWRLSIVDLTSNSDQPIADQEDIFVYNGELYDYADLGARFGISEKGDTRTFLSLLKKPGGYEAIKRAAGFFSYLRYSKHSQRVFGGRDVFGKKPLFFYVDSDLAVFSSEERGILHFLPKSRISAKALGEYLVYKTRLFGNAYFDGIRELAPGASFSFDIDRWKMSEPETWQGYYDRSLLEQLRSADPLQGAHSAARRTAAALRAEFEAAVDRRLSCDVPVQIALSGGVDSAAVAAASIRSKRAGNVRQAITVRFQEGLDESARARLTATSLGLQHHIVVFDAGEFPVQLKRAIRAMSGPLDHPHSLAYLCMCRDVRKFGKVLLTGEGADELFFGYRHYDRFNGESFAFREYLRPEDESAFRSRCSGGAFAAIREGAGIAALRSRAVASPLASRELEMKTHLISLLQRNDRMSMEHSVEIRAPFLDPSLIELALSGDPETPLAQRKQFVLDIVHDCLPDMPAFGEKNGFRVPFDENFPRIAASPQGSGWIRRAIEVLADEMALVLDPATRLSPRLGWSLLNIGCFVETHSA